jgi:hypothetical protein
VFRDPTLTAGVGQFAAIQSVAPSVGVEVSAISLRDASEIERAAAKFASVPNGGLILAASALSVVHHRLVVELAAQPQTANGLLSRYFASTGGLISYGYNLPSSFAAPPVTWGREAHRSAGTGTHHWSSTSSGNSAILLLTQCVTAKSGKG